MEIVRFKLQEMMNEKARSDGLEKLSQEAVARGANVSLRTVQNWIANKSTPNIELAGKLCRYFDCTFDDLFELVEDEDFALAR